MLLVFEGWDGGDFLIAPLAVQLMHELVTAMDP